MIPISKRKLPCIALLRQVELNVNQEAYLYAEDKGAYYGETELGKSTTFPKKVFGIVRVVCV